VAATEVAGEAALMVGAEAIASAVSLVGGVILVSVLIIQNRKAIRDALVARPGQLARVWLGVIEESKAFAIAPASVKVAMGDCKTAWRNATWAPLNGMLPEVRASLTKAGLDQTDIAGIVDMPDPRFAAGMGG
jgi:hypothetical protein